MRNLLNANRSRLLQSKLFWLALLGMAGFAAGVCVTEYHEMVLYHEPGYTEPLDTTLFQATQILGFVSAVVLSLFAGADYSNGTLRNKLVVGQRREYVYLAGYLTCAGAVLLLYILSSLVALILGAVLFSEPSASAAALMVAFLTGGMMCLAYGAVYYFIAMTCTSRTWTAIISLLLAGVMLLAAIKVSGALEQEEFTMQLVPEEYSTAGQAYSIEGVAEDLFDGLVMETVPNPNYLSGAKRETVQFLYDLNPAGQSLQLIAIPEQDVLHPARIILLDLGIVLICSLGGVLLFHRKDIK